MKKTNYKFYTGIVVITLLVGMTASNSAFAETTGFLSPTADGGEDSPGWDNRAGTACSGASCYTELIEASGNQCNSESDGNTSYITSNTTDARQTFLLDISAIPDGATVASVNVTACNQRQKSNASFQTAVCVDGACQDSGIDIAPTTGYDLNAQLHTVNFTKSASSVLEIGVKNTNNRSLRISKLRGNVTYTLPGEPTVITVGGGTSIVYPPPVISDIKTLNKDGVTAVEFTTNEPSTAQMTYGTESYYLTKYLSEGAGAATTHRIELPDIDLGTVYYFKVQAVSQHGVSAESEVQTLDFAPPTAENIRIVSAATSSAEIAWDTNEPTSAKVRYGKTTNLRSAIEASDLTKSHSLVIGGLTPRTQYFFHIESTDVKGNLSVGRLRSFITLKESGDGIILPPSDLSIVRQDKNIILSWQNPVDADFSFVVLLKKMGGQPKNYFDGQVLYNGSGKIFTVKDEIGAEYALYAVDRDGIFSEIVFANPDEFRYDVYLKGQTHSEINAIQEKLKTLGFFPATTPTSDWFGPTTEKSVKKFQKTISAKQNGILTEYQHDVLLGISSGSQWSFPQSEKQQGSSGDDIKELQQFLRDFGFFPFDARPSGYFGPLTRRSLLEYQKSVGISASGVFDTVTRERVNK